MGDRNRRSQNEIPHCIAEELKEEGQSSKRSREKLSESVRDLFDIT